MAYATTSDLSAWLAPDPVPDTAVRLLETASDVLDELLIGAYYNPDNPDVQAVLTKACVRQAQWMIDRDDETGADADIEQMTVGQRSFRRRAASGTGVGKPIQVAPRAVGVLRTAGLLTMWPRVVG